MTPFTGIPPKRSKTWPKDSTLGGMFVDPEFEKLVTRTGQPCRLIPQELP